MNDELGLCLRELKSTVHTCATPILHSPPPSPHTHTHTGLYILPDSRLANQHYDMEALTGCQEEIPEEEGEAAVARSPPTEMV